MNNATTQTTQETVTPARKAAITGLAAVGFIALIVLGLWLAVYSARLVPSAVNGLGSAAVYLGSIFTPSSSSPTTPSLSVVPTASTTLPFEDTSVVATTTATSTLPATHATSTATRSSSAAAPVYYRTATTTYSTSDSTPILQGPATYYGSPDLTVTIVAVGYLTGSSADSFVVSPSVPAGMHPAVEFIIKNIGTNIAGTSRFYASLPTKAIRYESAVQQALNPGDNIQYTLGFDQADKGTDETISVTTNFDGAISESSLDNNTATSKITVL